MRQPAGVEILKVGGRTDTNGLGGSISKSIRKRGVMLCRCLGAAATHQAAKGLAVAFGMLSNDGIEPWGFPMFEDGELDGQKRTFILIQAEPRTQAPYQGTVEYNVAGKTDPTKLAGAISPEIREGKLVLVDGIGAGPVNQAIKALAIVRGYVAPIGLDIRFRAVFVDKIIDGAERTATRLELCHTMPSV